MKIFDSLGGILVTHAAVGIGAFLVGRGWATAEQAQDFLKEVQSLWPALAVTAAGAVGAVAGKVANRD